MGKDLLALVLQPRIAIFILVCITVGMCTGLQWTFLYWYVEDLVSSTTSQELKCDYIKWVKLLQGIVAAVQCFLGEVPFFYLSGWFIKTLRHVNCMSLVLGAFGVRFLLYSILQNPWAILPIELLQGLTYGIFYATMATYAYRVGPDGTGATVQAIVSIMFEGIGVGLGSVLAGYLFKEVRGKTTFLIFGIFALAAGFLHIISMYFVKEQPALKTQQDANAHTKNMDGTQEEQESLNKGTMEIL